MKKLKLQLDTILCLNKWVFFFIVWGFSHASFALDFYESREWLNLLYYEKKGHAYLSLAESPDFFVSPQGKTNPKLEYEACLALTKNQDPEFKKKFPLRYKRLTAHHQLPFQPLVNPRKIHSIVLAYPNKYMQNPTSMFGHLFLIMNSQYGFLDSDIFHYLADTQESTNYAINGITGKFKGWFLSEPYYRKIKDYLYLEDRDVIYYDLTLSEDQIEEFQLHALELKNTYFYYYFFDRNCAFFIGKALNVVLDSDVVSKQILVFPSAVANALIDHHIAKNQYKKTLRTTLFQETFNPLSSQEKKAVARLMSEKVESPTDNAAVLTAFLYLSESGINQKPDLASIIRYNRIQAYTSLKGTPIRPIFCNPAPPSFIPSKGLELSLKDSFSFRYQPILYSQYENFNTLTVKETNFLSPALFVTHGQNLKLDFTLVDMSSITQHDFFFRPYSWSLSSRFLYQDTVMTNQSFKIGKAFALHNKQLLISLIGLDYSNYDILIERKKDTLSLRPSLLLGLKTIVFPHYLNTDLSYHYQYDTHYVSASLFLKLSSFIVTTAYIHPHELLTLKGQYLF